MTFFKKLVTLCTRRGVSPRAVALAIGFDPSAIAQWKRRGGLPRPAISAQIADYFGITIEDLLDDTRELSTPAIRKEVKSHAKPGKIPSAPPGFIALTPCEFARLHPDKVHGLMVSLLKGGPGQIDGSLRILVSDQGVKTGEVVPAPVVEFHRRKAQ